MRARRSGGAALAGADGGRDGVWVVARGWLDGSRVLGVTASIEASWASVVAPEGANPPEVVAVDIPIGLPEGAERGGREADRRARAALAERRSSVFPAPSRAALERARELGFAPEAYAEVASRSAATSAVGLGLSKQAFFLLPRIDEVDRHLRRHPADVERVFEVHPELAFQMLTGGRGLSPKRTFRGQIERLRALEAGGIEVVSEVLMVAEHPSAGPSDLLDALACLWSAARIHRGVAQCLPPAPPRDAHGLPMAIWA